MADSDGAAAAGTADRMCAAVAEQLAEWGDGDEVMVLAAHRLREPGAGWSMEFPANPRALAGLREGLHGWLEELGVRESDCTDVELAVWEAAVNATVHGRPRLGTGTVRVSAGLDGAGSAVIRVSDRGQWRIGDSLAPGHGWSGGRGLSVISQVSDELSISPGPGGTTSPCAGGCGGRSPRCGSRMSRPAGYPRLPVRDRARGLAGPQAWPANAPHRDRAA
jgi:anti-sigma regulatory factor (Ser/Thr protein kinase)